MNWCEVRGGGGKLRLEGSKLDRSDEDGREMVGECEVAVEESELEGSELKVDEHVPREEFDVE